VPLSCGQLLISVKQGHEPLYTVESLGSRSIITEGSTSGCHQGMYSRHCSAAFANWPKMREHVPWFRMDGWVSMETWTHRKFPRVRHVDSCSFS
jgi:hypothetical protein